MKETILNKLNVDHPLKTEYQIAFIKHLLQELEDHNTEEIHDLIYEQLTVKLKDERPDFSFKHFVINEDDAITMKESNSFIRDGTTGLKLWPAAIALADFVVQRKTEFHEKSVLELGTGASGFVGMVLLKVCKLQKVFLSDCHEAVLENLTTNILTNLKDITKEAKEKSLLFHQRLKLDNAELGILNLPWEDVDKHKAELEERCLPNILLASDVVYDDSLFTALITCITKLFELSGPSLVFFLSQSIRNFETFDKFCHLLHQNRFEVAEEQLQPETFNWESQCEIKILRISKLA